MCVCFKVQKSYQDMFQLFVISQLLNLITLHAITLNVVNVHYHKFVCYLIFNNPLLVSYGQSNYENNLHYVPQNIINIGKHKLFREIFILPDVNNFIINTDSMKPQCLLLM